MWTGPIAARASDGDYSCLVAKGLATTGAALIPGPVVGRTWWAQVEFTRINITPTMLRKKIEDLREADANLATSRQSRPGGQCS
jgi:hypothetical protein